jgi:SAM-dependent methyltransferase
MDEFSKFYTAFEDRFRGSFELIKERLADYLPILQSINITGGSRHAILDLGSGRGEWLELLKENGFVAEGVDQNPYSVQRGVERGLNITVGDIFNVIAEKPQEIFSCVTAFHVVEHLTWELQLKLFREAYRLLLPGGALIIEWPNIENLKVASNYFWLDPTHLRPYPVALATFMAEYVGFLDIRTFRFRPNWQAPVAHTQSAQSNLIDRLFKLNAPSSRSAIAQVDNALSDLLSPGADIAIVARKSGSLE